MPAVVEPGGQPEPNLADDLGPKVQGLARRLPGRVGKRRPQRVVGHSPNYTTRGPLRIGARFWPSRCVASNLARRDRQSAHGRLRNAGPLFAPRICQANELWNLLLRDALLDELVVGRR